MENNKTEHQDQVVDFKKWGYPLQELYRLALSFYRQNSGKALHVSYEDNLKLIAFKQQATVGAFDEKKAPALGVLDVIGRDRRLHWQMLGSMSREQAMEGFIDLLDQMCSAFRPYVEAVKQNREDMLREDLRKMEEEKFEREKREKKQQDLMEEGYKEEIQRRHLQDALNRQTYLQFKGYAEKQFPGNPEQQAVLIRQLQQEHYHQYVQQLHIQNLGSSLPVSLNSSDATNTDGPLMKENNVNTQSPDTTAEKVTNEAEAKLVDEDNYVLISPARMWTRPDIAEFKAEVSSGDGDGVITIGHGDTVTVRIPTNANGKSLFWEFATDNYDIGFGVFFEWAKPLTNEVTVHVSDSDDDDEEFTDEDYLSTDGDLECGGGSGSNDHQNAFSNTSAIKPPISIIVPIYRRECYNEVYVGSHAYPGEGVYLLKFDNSYSIWRSKTLFYRIYYER